ncbi:hypothetical protein FPQ18DRAFT_404635 [Pyronema domesticum]|nr:hypothetical protein FPQ18DRAFT_404635 [Pyronema domesticum]
MCEFCPPPDRPVPVFINTVNGASIQARWERDNGLPPPLSRREKARLMRDMQRRRARRDLEANRSPEEKKRRSRRQNILLGIMALLIVIAMIVVGTQWLKKEAEKTKQIKAVE